MNKKLQNFNALEFKDKMQEKMWNDFQANKDKFKTYADYLDFVCSQPLGDPKFDAWWEDIKQNTAGKNSRVA